MRRSDSPFQSYGQQDSQGLNNVEKIGTVEIAKLAFGSVYFFFFQVSKKTTNSKRAKADIVFQISCVSRFQSFLFVVPNQLKKNKVFQICIWVIQDQ